MRPGVRTLLLKFYRSTNWVLRRIWTTLTSLTRIPRFLNSPERTQTYFPDAVRKSQVRIWLENIQWAIRHAELNEYYFVYGMDRKQGNQNNNYIACREGMDLIRKANSQAWSGIRGTDYRCLCKDKFIFGQYLKALSFRTPRNLALYLGSQLYWLDRGRVEDLKSVLDVDGLDVICKDVLGAHGKAVFFLTVENGKIHVDGVETSLDDFREKIPVPALFQERLTQHPEMAQIYSDSINTLRLVTVRRNCDIAPFRAFVRFGTSGRRVDNWAAGGLAVGVDLETGRLWSHAVFRPGKGGFVVSHPDTGFRFEAFEIPFFKEAVEQASRLHRYFYGLASVGWDIAITPEGPAFIEGNHGWEIWAMQAIIGGLKAELRSAISIPQA